MIGITLNLISFITGKFSYSFNFPTLSIFIKNPDDAIIYPIIFAIAEFIRLILSFFVLNFFFKIPIIKPSFEIIKQQIRDGWATFCFDFYMLFTP